MNELPFSIRYLNDTLGISLAFMAGALGTSASWMSNRKCNDTELGYLTLDQAEKLDVALSEHDKKNRLYFKQGLKHLNELKKKEKAEALEKIRASYGVKHET